MKVEIQYFKRLFIPLYVTPQCQFGSLEGEGISYYDPDDIPEWYRAEMCAGYHSFKFSR